MSLQKQQTQVNNLGGFCLQKGVNLRLGICSAREDVCYGWMGYNAETLASHVSLVMVISELVTC